MHSIYALWALLLPLLIVAVANCNPNQSDASATEALVVQEVYDSLLADNVERMKWFKTVYAEAETEAAKKEKLKEARNYLHRILTEEVYPTWYGTPWDYYGTTETPQNGEIACGYFVSTTLKQVGFKLERFKLAQQPASNIITTLCDASTLKRIGHNNTSALVQHLNASQDGIYILGLDNHVAFVWKEGAQLSIVHSTSSVFPARVIKEPMADSRIVTRSANYYIANFLDNEAILEQWIKQEEIPTVL